MSYQAICVECTVRPFCGREGQPAAYNWGHFWLCEKHHQIEVTKRGYDWTRSESELTEITPLEA